MTSLTFFNHFMGLATIGSVGMVFVREKTTVNETIINNFEINQYLKGVLCHT